jgi:hypothetical protein
MPGSPGTFAQFGWPIWGSCVAATLEEGIRRLLRDNGLSIALLALFLVSIGGQVIFGWRAFLEEQQEHGLQGVGLGGYLATGHFLSATFENWESETLARPAAGAG